MDSDGEDIWTDEESEENERIIAAEIINSHGETSWCYEKSEEKSVKKKSEGKKSVKNKCAKNKSKEKKSTKKKCDEKKSEEQESVEKKRVGKKSVKKKSDENKCEEKRSAKKKSGEKKSVEKKSEEKNSEEQEMEEEIKEESGKEDCELVSQKNIPEKGQFEKKGHVFNKEKRSVKMDGFYEMELDDRILKAIEELGWESPTLIQAKAIPFLLAGKDVMLRARTGSGKTAAFAIPIIQNILTHKMIAKEQEVGALILAPSRELCEQIHRNFKELTRKCSQVVSCINIGTQIKVEAQIPLLLSKPDVVVSTPSRALEHLNMKTLVLKKSLRMLVIDEADLIFTFGYKEATKEILSHLPSVYQSALASATLTDDVQGLKSMVMHNPITLKLSESLVTPLNQCSHYVLSAQESDKAAVLYTIFKLKLIKGKILIFVNTVDKCYKLKLFLEQFGIRSCLLNSELPANVRCHTVTQFNRNLYDIIIASDERTVQAPTEVKPKNHQKTKRRKDEESGVARGIDFNDLSVVLNFDFPLDVVSYIHRSGRTARGKRQGSVLSLVSTRERRLMEKVDACLRTVLGTKEKIMKTFEFKMEEVEGFRYRSRDAWKAATRVAVREARLQEIKQEIFNSESLKGYFEDNPKDYSTLRHDKALHTVRLQPHLRDVPDYLVPENLKPMVDIKPIAQERKRYKPQVSKTKRKYLKRKSDPLQSLSFKIGGKSARR